MSQVGLPNTMPLVAPGTFTAVVDTNVPILPALKTYLQQWRLTEEEFNSLEATAKAEIVISFNNNSYSGTYYTKEEVDSDTKALRDSMQDQENRNQLAMNKLRGEFEASQRVNCIDMSAWCISFAGIVAGLGCFAANGPDTNFYGGIASGSVGALSAFVEGIRVINKKNSPVHRK